MRRDVESKTAFCKFSGTKTSLAARLFGVRQVVTDFLCHLRPGVLNGVQVRRVRWPGKQLDALSVKQVEALPSSVRSRPIWHKCHPVLWDAASVLPEEGDNRLLEDLFSVPIPIQGPIHACISMPGWEISGPNRFHCQT